MDGEGLLMGTGIEWTQETWNPVTGCTKVSQGCKGCYAEGVADRFWPTQYPPNPDGSPRRFTDVRCHPERLDQPLRWRKPRMVFVNSMSDLFHEDVPDAFIEECFRVMWQAKQHTYQVLTKRPARMRDFVLRDLSREQEAIDAGIYPGNAQPWNPPPNVWLGVSVEDQATADERIPILLDTPAAVRFVSYEPALGPVDFGNIKAGIAMVDALAGFASWPDGQLSAPEKIDWLIVGGESGPGARPFDLAWARDTIRQCREAGVACFVKQLGRDPFRRVVTQFGMSESSLELRDRKGGSMEEWPADLRVREFPDARDEVTP